MHSRGHTHALGFHFRGKHFGLVRLSGIHQPPLRFRRVFGNPLEVAPRVEQLLCGEHAQKRHFHRAFHSFSLLLRLDLRQFGLFGEDVAAKFQLPRSDQRLLDKKPLLSAAERSAAYLIARIADRWIRIKPRLLLPRSRGANFRFRLPHRRIHLARDFLHLFQRHQLALGVRLCAPHPRILRFHGTYVSVMMLSMVLLRRHRHLLRFHGAGKHMRHCQYCHRDFRCRSHRSPSSSVISGVKLLGRFKTHGDARAPPPARRIFSWR